MNPQRAYAYSVELFEWGSGNSASNQLYFVATQPSFDNICNTDSQTPEGVYTIQDATTGRFLSMARNGHLVAMTSNNVLATKFILAFKPGGGTIKSIINNKFVTGSPDGKQPLAAARDIALGYEIFRWIRQPDNSYQLIAMVNRAKVISDPVTGELFNPNGNTIGDKFILHPSDDHLPSPIPTFGMLRNNNTFVVSTATNPTLKVTTDMSDKATQWFFEKNIASQDIDPQYAIRNGGTNKYVSANMEGNVPLAATVAVPREWEYFQIIAYNGSYVIRHVINGQVVALQDDNTLIDNTNEIDNTTLWQIY